MVAFNVILLASLDITAPLVLLSSASVRRPTTKARHTKPSLSPCDAASPPRSQIDADAPRSRLRCSSTSIYHPHRPGTDDSSNTERARSNVVVTCCTARASSIEAAAATLTSLALFPLLLQHRDSSFDKSAIRRRRRLLPLTPSSWLGYFVALSAQLSASSSSFSSRPTLSTRPPAALSSPS